MRLPGRREIAGQVRLRGFRPAARGLSESTSGVRACLGSLARRACTPPPARLGSRARRGRVRTTCMRARVVAPCGPSRATPDSDHYALLMAPQRPWRCLQQCSSTAVRVLDCRPSPRLPSESHRHRQCARRNAGLLQWLDKAAGGWEMRAGLGTSDLLLVREKEGGRHTRARAGWACRQYDPWSLSRHSTRFP